MADIVLNDGITVSIRGRHDGQRTINTFHYRVTAVPNVLVDETFVLSAFLTDFEANVYEAFRKQVCDAWTGAILRAQKVYPNRSYFVERVPALVEGDLNEEALPSLDAAELYRYTFRNDRHGRGRIFLPAQPANATSGSNWLPQRMPELDTLALTVFDHPGPVSGYSFKACLIPGGNVLMSDDDNIRTVGARREVTSQAQRRYGRGE